MAVKLVRISLKAHKELQTIAKAEDISLRQALDIVVETRDRLERKVNNMHQTIDALKWDLKYIVKEMKKRKAITFPDHVSSGVHGRSIFPTKYLI